MFFVIFICNIFVKYFCMYNNDSQKKKKKHHPGVVDYFKELPFYNKHSEKPKIKCLKHIDLLSEFPFYEELNVITTNHAFRG